MIPEGTKILVVDDFKTMRKMVSKALRGFGLNNIEEADDGQTALPMLKEAAAAGEPFQLVLSDWNMPVMSGLELLKSIRADDSLKTIPLIMITAEGEQSQILDAAKAGVTDYIVKPFSPETLKGKLTTVADKIA